jgi:DNA-binding response OmpR family regulator
MRILVVEDEKKLAGFIKRALREDGHAVDVSHDGEEGALLALRGDYDAIILDLQLPRRDGISVLRDLREKKKATPVIVLTARDTLKDRIRGLDEGADDYLTKPFAFDELVARVQALARRTRPALPPVFERAGVVLDLPRHQASREGRHLALSPKEFAVLEVLMRAEGAVVSAEELLDKAWDEHADPFTNAVRVAVMTLRRKLGDPPVIDTLPGAGYRLT